MRGGTGALPAAARKDSTRWPLCLLPPISLPRFLWLRRGLASVSARAPPCFSLAFRSAVSGNLAAPLGPAFPLLSPFFGYAALSLPCPVFWRLSVCPLAGAPVLIAAQRLPGARRLGGVAMCPPCRPSTPHGLLVGSSLTVAPTCLRCGVVRHPQPPKKSVLVGYSLPRPFL